MCIRDSVDRGRQDEEHGERGNFSEPPGLPSARTAFGTCSYGFHLGTIPKMTSANTVPKKAPSVSSKIE